jgi:hypothetical protein
MAAIDDPIDAVHQQFPDKSQGVFAVASRFSAPFNPFAGVLDAARQYFSDKGRDQRVNAFLEAFEFYIKRHERQIEELSDKINSPEFVEPFIVAINKAIETTNIIKIKRFAAVMAYELVTDGTPQSLEDAAAFIRALNELGEEDIKALRLLHRHQTQYRYQDYNLVIDQYGKILPRIAEAGFTTDDFYARCSRLGGYGLVLQLDIRGTIIQIPTGEFVFRITELGKKLTDILLSAKDEEVIPQ